MMFDKFFNFFKKKKFSTINSWDEFSPLKTVLLGSVFAPEFFTDINTEILGFKEFTHLSNR